MLHIPLFYRTGCFLFRATLSKHCRPDDPADAEQGSCWDHVILDPDTKLIVSLVVGRRDADSVVHLFTDFYGRTGGHLPQLIASDEYAPCRAVILDVYGVLREELTLTPEQQRQYDRDRMGQYFFPVEITYATAHKEKENGRAVGVDSRVVFGTASQAEAALAESERPEAINTSSWSATTGRRGSSTPGRRGRRTRSPRS